MGMFDDLKPWTEHFTENEVFNLLAAKLGPKINTTDYGERPTVLLKIETPEKPDGDIFSIFGDGLVAQVERMERGDLPARVAIVRQNTRSGNNQVKVIVPESKLGDDDIPF